MPVCRLLLPLLGFFCLQGFSLQAQLDSIHWLPPMHARVEWGPQFLYLSTPEPDSFPVSIRDGSGQLLLSVTISNTKPFRYFLGSSDDTPVLVPESKLHKPLKDRGLILDGPKKFYAYFRAHSGTENHAGDLTCKGRAALGTEFRIGMVVQAVWEQDIRSNFVGIMASEDSTEIVLSGFDKRTDFRIDGKDVPSTGPVTMLLNRGESAVFSTYIFDDGVKQPPNGLMGALLKSSKPVAVNCGTWVGAPVFFMGHDIGIDQIAPFEKVGKEYILCKGAGSTVLEHPVVIAHVDGTKVWINDLPDPASVLDAGEYYIVPTQRFSSAGNMSIHTSKPAFVYQMIGGTTSGDDAKRTAGLLFVPPISCGIPNSVDNIYQPNRIGEMYFDGGLMIVAMRDSTVTVRVDGVKVSIGGGYPVPGNPDFVTYRKLNLFSQDQSPNTVSVVAEGAVQVAMFGRNAPASFAAFFSGFDKAVRPEISLLNTGDGICPDTLFATGRFDGVQWLYEDSILQFGKDTFLIAYAPGHYQALGYLGVCRQADYAEDSTLVSFLAPEVPFSSLPPQCFGGNDGVLDIGAPSGGIPPYEYSIDNGQSFFNQSHFDGLGAGAYSFVVRDSAGCFSKPLKFKLKAPDSLAVKLVPIQVPEPLKAGEKVLFQALPNRPVVDISWTPDNHSNCPGCVFYSYAPDETTWVVVEVTDSIGCHALDSFLVVVDPRVYAPNVFQPDAQAPNDRFTLFSREPLPVRYLSIFDRWGEKVFERRDFFTNDSSMGWDGATRGKPAPPGVYVFVAEVEVAPGRTERLKGDLTLLR
ncbi:MAG: gliding motility-associated C-terminal domain-containing protein [Saprospiraceae bacterium]|nr:gliding motility-associated C-terminal domain-containing protein [Saprospiraceae bacterium]